MDKSMSTAPIKRRKRRSNKVIQYIVGAVTAMAVANVLIELSAPLAKYRLRRSKLRYFGTPEGDVCMQIVGDEPTVLVLHDLQPGCSMTDFAPLDADMASCRYVAVDLLGYGRSDRPSTKYNVAMHTDHVQDILMQYPSIKMVVTCGYSASIAITLANRDAFAHGIVMINPEYGHRNAPVLEVIAKIPVIGPFAYHMNHLLGSRNSNAAITMNDRYGNIHRSGSTNVTHGPQLSDLCESIVIPVDSDIHVIHISPDETDEGWNKVRGIVFSE